MLKWLTHDWGLKLISFILAVGLWYYAVGEESVEVERTIPLEIEVMNEQMSVLDSSVRARTGVGIFTGSPGKRGGHRAVGIGRVW